MADNLLAQDFTATEPNRSWTADISCVPTGEGWLFLSTVMDLFSRRTVGWAIKGRAILPLAIMH